MLNLSAIRKVLAGYASTSTPTAVNAGDAVDYYVDQYGRLHVSVDNAASITIGAVYEAGTAVVGSDSETGATAHHELVADPGSGLTIYVRGLAIQNTGATTDTFQLETDTAGARTAVGPVWTVPAGDVLNLAFGGPGLPCTVHKNLGYTAVGTSAFVILVDGVSR